MSGADHEAGQGDPLGGQVTQQVAGHAAEGVPEARRHDDQAEQERPAEPRQRVLSQQEREVEREEAGHQPAADGAPEGVHHPDRQGSQPGPEPVAPGPGPGAGGCGACRRAHVEVLLAGVGVDPRGQR